ncbi:MAG: class I lanthipeptide [Hyphomicrobiales bacterium]
MKKKNLKLSFNKQTIAKLNSSEKNQIVGASNICATIQICVLTIKDCIYTSPTCDGCSYPCQVTKDPMCPEPSKICHSVIC